MTTTTQVVHTLGERVVNAHSTSQKDPSSKIDLEMQHTKGKNGVDIRVRFGQATKKGSDESDQKKSKRKSKRTDRLGNSIRKGSRKHHVSFRDQVLGQAVASVFLVQSYKDYNKMEEKFDNGCRCQIF